jgi:hypothetical protein
MKNQKGKPCQMDLPLLRNDITRILRPQKPVIYSRYQRFGVDDSKPLKDFMASIFQVRRPLSA